MNKMIVNLYKIENMDVLNAFDMITTNIYMNNKDKRVKTIALTSDNSREGKTTVAISLSVSMANAGWKVLLIDADLRRSAAKRLNVSSNAGLTEYLSGRIEYADAIYDTNIINLKYLVCGNYRYNPTGLLCSPRFEELMEKAGNDYDFVIIDTPALMYFNDAILISKQADAAILVVELDKTDMERVLHKKKELERQNIRILGALINKVNKHDYKKLFKSTGNYMRHRKHFGKDRESDVSDVQRLE